MERRGILGPMPRLSSRHPLVTFSPCASVLGVLLLLALFASARAEVRHKHSPPLSPEKPDLLVFTNGDQLTGTLLRGMGDQIVFRSDMAGEITIPLSRVKELRPGGRFAVLEKEGAGKRGFWTGSAPAKEPVPRGRIEVRTGEVLVAGDGSGSAPGSKSAPAPAVGETAGAETARAAPMAGELPIPADRIAFVVDERTYVRELEGRPSLAHGWAGNVTAGAILVRSTESGSSFNTGLTLLRTIPSVTYLPPRTRSSLNLSETYGRLRQPVIPETDPPSPDLIVKTSIFHNDLERDQYVSTRFYALGQSSFDHNYSQGLDLQQVYGAGIGWTPISTPKHQLDVKADVHYEKQTFQTAASNVNLFGSSFSENYRANLRRGVLFTENVNVLPAWNDAHAFSANGSAGVSVPVFRRFNLNFTATDSFLNNPAYGFRKNSFQFVTAVGYTLR